jgi:hypothetical protein
MAKAANNSSASVVELEVPQASEPFVGQWNRLVSTTNWEKGRIICEWRESLLTSGVAVTDYSDEAWAQLVGGVTSQHVGRLRRVFQRFGDGFDQYPGLFWSHFQASLDWDDAPMWLEGAIQNDWSVSQMRGKRWETLGTPPADQQAELNETDEFDHIPAMSASVDIQEPEAPVAAVSPKTTSVKSVATETETDEVADDEDSEAPFDDAPATKAAPKRQALNVDVELLPDDLADAFEQFKLAIIAQRREGWRDVTPQTVVECLDALKELAMAEA